MPKANILFTGIGIGEVIASGRLFIIEQQSPRASRTKSSLSISEEKTRLAKAVAQVEEDLSLAVARTSSEAKDILSALRAIFLDYQLQSRLVASLEEGWSSESAANQVFQDYAQLLGSQTTLKEDFLDLGRQLETKLSGSLDLNIPTEDPIIILAKNLSPMQSIKLKDNVVGIILKDSGPTSHTAIICRQKGIATLVSARGSQHLVKNGDQVTINTISGTAYLGHNVEKNISPQTRKRVGAPLSKVRLNVGSIADLRTNNEVDLDGVGLVRTEMFFLESQVEPDSAEQIQIYEAILKSAPKGKVVFRTFDSGSDKPLAFIPESKDESNWNTEDYWKVIDTQLKCLALVQESVGRDVSVMAPMIESVSQTEAFVTRAKGFGINSAGVMVELPSLSLEVLKLKDRVDFLSIGTNDLAKYLFGLNREKLLDGESLDTWNPEILSRVAFIAEAAKQIGVEVSVCGEAAADPLLSIVLAGLGIDVLSMAGPSVSRVLEYLSSVTLEQAKELAKQALAQSDGAAVRAVVLESLGR